MNQYRNALNKDLVSKEMLEAVQMLLASKKCWEEAAAADQTCLIPYRLERAVQAHNQLRATIEIKLKQIGWKWDELEQRANRMQDKL